MRPQQQSQIEFESISLTDRMSLLDRTHILAYTKWFAFTICTIGFSWKVSDSFIHFLSKEIGTKTDLKANYEADLPGMTNKNVFFPNWCFSFVNMLGLFFMILKVHFVKRLSLGIWSSSTVRYRVPQ